MYYFTSTFLVAILSSNHMTVLSLNVCAQINIGFCHFLKTMLLENVQEKNMLACI